MANSLIKHFKKTISLSLEEEELIASKIREQHVKKRRFLLHKNSNCNQLSYIDQGCMRVYDVDDYLLENNIYFAMEDWWAIDLKSFIEESKARFYIQALTDCKLSQIHKVDFDRLLIQIPKLEKWFRVLLQNALISSENRINYKIALSAEERYRKFQQKYPGLESRVSQRHIASYLGISPEFLSKIRSKQFKRKS